MSIIIALVKSSMILFYWYPDYPTFNPVTQIVLILHFIVHRKIHILVHWIPVLNFMTRYPIIWEHHNDDDFTTLLISWPGNAFNPWTVIKYSFYCRGPPGPGVAKTQSTRIQSRDECNHGIDPRHSFQPKLFRMPPPRLTKSCIASMTGPS